MYVGFQLAYGLSDNVTARYATILSIPATFGTAFGFVFIYGKIIMCMSNSKLLPEFLSYRHPTTRSPYMALIVGSVVSYCICIGGLYYPAFHKQTFNISMFAASYDYVWQMVGYILLRTKYQTIKCDFRSPFGIYGAVWSMLVFGVTLFSVMVFQIDYLALIIGSAVCGSLSVWYFIYAKWHQSFSEEEQKTFFTIHVINCKYYVYEFILCICRCYLCIHMRVYMCLLCIRVCIRMAYLCMHSIVCIYIHRATMRLTCKTPLIFHLFSPYFR